MTDCVAVDPSVTLPNAKVAALSVNFGPDVAAIPVPERLTVVFAPVLELLVMDSVPESIAAVMGVNASCKFNVAPGANVAGKIPETIENPVPAIVSELTATGLVPVDFSVSVCVAVVTTTTLPKPRLEALTLNVATAGTISQILKLYRSEVGEISPTVTLVPLVAVKAVDRCTQYVSPTEARSW